MTKKNMICLWYDGTAMDAARFYAETFPGSAVGAVMRAPGDYPDGKQGDVLTVEFTVIGIPCVGLNGGPQFKHNEVLFPDRDRRSGRNRPLVERDCRKRRAGKRMRMV
jgi:predicted 3-demethylubiquinone-9 3-methyltransferase (glyoxalase superfamily)